MSRGPREIGSKKDVFLYSHARNRPNRMGATASLKRARPSGDSESSAQMAADGAQVVSVVRRQSTRRQVIHASATQYRALQRLRDD